MSSTSPSSLPRVTPSELRSTLLAAEKKVIVVDVRDEVRILMGRRSVGGDERWKSWAAGIRFFNPDPQTEKTRTHKNTHTLKKNPTVRAHPRHQGRRPRPRERAPRPRDRGRLSSRRAPAKGRRGGGLGGRRPLRAVAGARPGVRRGARQQSGRLRLRLRRERRSAAASHQDLGAPRRVRRVVRGGRGAGLADGGGAREVKEKRREFKIFCFCFLTLFVFSKPLPLFRE